MTDDSTHTSRTHPDLFAVEHQGKRIGVFHRNGMKWRNAAARLQEDGFIPSKLDIMSLGFTSLPLSEELPADIPKAKRRARGTAPTNAHQIERIHALAQKLGKREKLQIPELAVDAQRQLKALGSEYDARLARGEIHASQAQLEYAQAIAKELGIDVSFHEQSSKAEVHDFISRHVDAFQEQRDAEERELRARHDLFIGTRIQDITGHFENWGDPIDAPSLAFAFDVLKAGGNVEAMHLMLEEVLLDEIAGGPHWGKLQELERAGQMPGAFRKFGRGKIRILTAQYHPQTASLTGHVHHHIAAQAAGLDADAYWAIIASMIEAIVRAAPGSSYRKLTLGRARHIAYWIFKTSRFEQRTVGPEDLEKLYAFEQQHIREGIAAERRYLNLARTMPDAFDSDNPMDWPV